MLEAGLPRLGRRSNGAPWGVDPIQRPQDVWRRGLHPERHTGETALSQHPEHPDVDRLGIRLGRHLGIRSDAEGFNDAVQQPHQSLRTQHRRCSAADEHGARRPFTEFRPPAAQLQQRGVDERDLLLMTRRNVGVEVAVPASRRAERHVNVNAERVQRGVPRNNDARSCGSDVASHRRRPPRLTPDGRFSTLIGCVAPRSASVERSSARCIALAGAWAVVPSAGQDVIASRSFVSAYPLSDPSKLDRYSLTTGRPLGVLIRVPPLRAGAANVTGSTPHPLTGGGYMLTLDQDPACRSSHGPCHPRPGDCLSQVETLRPNSRRSRVLFSVTGSWRVLDAVPSPDGRSVALLEDECWSAASARLEVRDLASGHTQLLTDQLSVCGLGFDVSWNPKSTEVVFAYGRHPDLNAPPAGCELATAPADRISGPSSWRLIRVEASCGFDAGTFDSAGIVG